MLQLYGGNVLEITVKEKKPLIAVFGSRSDNKSLQIIRINYMKSLSDAGAVPVLAPMFATPSDYAQIADMADGFLLAGGVDIDPHRYGEEVLEECGEIDYERDRSEFDLYSVIKDMKKPVFGICRGIQTMNVMRGGTLWQDIPSQRPSGTVHSQKALGKERTHTVRAEEDSLLFDIVGKKEFAVNSFHHQAVKDTSLKISAYAEDGLIEAIEDPSLPFFLGVQWHPEYTTSVDEESRRLFSAFVSAARSGM